MRSFESNAVARHMKSFVWLLVVTLMLGLLSRPMLNRDQRRLALYPQSQ